jgi:hypothetical protein
MSTNDENPCRCLPVAQQIHKARPVRASGEDVLPRQLADQRGLTAAELLEFTATRREWFAARGIATGMGPGLSGPPRHLGGRPWLAAADCPRRRLMWSW